jgi:hypothetical protein
MNLQENIQRIKEVMGVEDKAPFNEVLIHLSGRREILQEGTVYAWLYDDPDALSKLQSGEYSFITFPRPDGMQIGGQDLLNKIWTKQFQKTKKGIEHLMGIIEGFWDEENKTLQINMMTVNPNMRRQGINTYMIQELRKDFNISQDQIIFDEPTDQGQKFIDSKQYE